MPIHQEGNFCGGCEKKLESVHPILVEWFHQMKAKYTNLHIAWGFRNAEEQERCFKSGASILHFPFSKHNHLNTAGKPESLAIDLFQVDEDGMDRWSPAFYFKLNEEIQAEYGPKAIRWGGTFRSKNGKPKPDAPHFEVV